MNTPEIKLCSECECECRCENNLHPVSHKLSAYFTSLSFAAVKKFNSLPLTAAPQPYASPMKKGISGAKKKEAESKRSALDTSTGTG
jgi:hypothetical protein